jgi:hypothetical protein
MTKEQIKPIVPPTLFLVGCIVGTLISFFSYEIMEVGFYFALAILIPACYLLSFIIGHNAAGLFAMFVIFPLAACMNGVLLGTILYWATKIFIRKRNNEI